MPTYRATLAYNARAYRVAEFEAADDGAARAHALAIEEICWPELNYDSNDFDDASCRDAVVMLDELMLDETDEGRCIRTIEDDMPLRDEMPYGSQSQVLVRKMASLTIDIDMPAAGRAAVLVALIREARKLCGID